MAFSDDDRDKVRSATNIADLIAEMTTVKRSGRNHMAVCVFHQEKTPSMSVDVARGLYYCHGCHAKGDVFTFVQETQGLTFPEALEWLAKRAGITLTFDPAAARKAGKRHELIDAVQRAADFYHRRLMKGSEAGHARAYLRSRGYDADTVADFKLGYAPAAGDALAKELRAQGVPDRAMVDAGLAKRGRSGLYDYFRDRLMFPTNDIQGEPVGFGGRILGDGQPKYLNTPETPIYKKSRLLYGLDRARREIQKAGYAVVVEGYTDVIALHRNGIPLAVATNGTALGDDHFELLRRFADRIVLAFDSDAAGGRAALRGDELEIPVRLDLDLRVADLPSGVDPAEMVARGDTEDLRDAVERARPLLQFVLERELATYDLTEPESRARALRSLGPRIARVSDDIARTEYARFVASRMGVDLDVVLDSIGRPRRRGSRQEAQRPRRADAGRTRLERELLRSVLADPKGAVEALVEADLFHDELVRSAFDLIRPLLATAGEDGPLDLTDVESVEGKLLVELAFDPSPPAKLRDVGNKIRVFDLDRRIETLRDEVSRLAPEEQPSSVAYQVLLRLHQEKREIERQ